MAIEPFSLVNSLSYITSENHLGNNWTLNSTWKSSSVISFDVLKLVKDFSGTPWIIASIMTGAQPMGQDYWGILATLIRSVGWEGIQPVDCGPLCTLSLGLNVAQALVIRCNMSGALIKRHPHIGLTSDWVQFIILDRNLLSKYVKDLCNPPVTRVVLIFTYVHSTESLKCWVSMWLWHTGLLRGENDMKGSLCFRWSGFCVYFCVLFVKHSVKGSLRHMDTFFLPTV